MAGLRRSRHGVVLVVHSDGVVYSGAGVVCGGGGMRERTASSHIRHARHARHACHTRYIGTARRDARANLLICYLHHSCAILGVLCDTTFSRSVFCCCPANVVFSLRPLDVSLVALSALSIGRRVAAAFRRSGCSARCPACGTSRFRVRATVRYQVSFTQEVLRTDIAPEGPRTAIALVM